jgi:pSer/pThr/pTyr-binding forkhead associated (FHA) protein
MLDFLRHLERAFHALDGSGGISHDTAVQMLRGTDNGCRDFMVCDMGLGVFVAEADENRFALHQGANEGFRALYLHCFQGPDRGKVFKVKERSARLGSSPENEIELNDSTTSRFHARIDADPRGHRLVDTESKNGTYVGELRVMDAFLAPSALIRIGGTVLRFQQADEPVEIELSRAERFGRLIGRSVVMRELFALLERVAPTDTTVLIEGESGTGKELVAEALHQHSRRAAGPLVVFDCSAVAPNLVESELFGHVKGAFTGAAATRTGAFERAHNGTLFLDEIGELPIELQPKLLRALEQREVRAVGGDRTVKVNVRIVAATNRTLTREVEAGHFREDL